MLAWGSRGCFPVLPDYLPERHAKRGQAGELHEISL